MSPTTRSSVQIAFAGDVALGGEFVAKERPKGAPGCFPFSALTPELGDVDLMVVNLEGPIGQEGAPRIGRSALLYNETAVLDWLAGFPACICILANNHTLDYGAEALKRTIDELDARGIHRVGAGRDQAEAEKPLVLEAGGQKVAFLAFTTDEPHVGSVIAKGGDAGCAGIPEAGELRDRVAALRHEADAVVVALHWGHEYYNFPQPRQIAVTRALVDAGATVVVGHHPHVQQGCLESRGGLVCHSLGNLFLPEMRNPCGRIQYRKPATKQYAVLHTRLCDGRLASWELKGGRCDRKYVLRPYRGARGQEFDAEMEALSMPLARDGYEEFWDGYRATQQKRLQREGLRDAVAKLLKTDFRTLLTTFSREDLSRNARRLLGILRRGPRGQKHRKKGSGR